MAPAHSTMENPRVRRTSGRQPPTGQDHASGEINHQVVAVKDEDHEDDDPFHDLDEEAEEMDEQDNEDDVTSGPFQTKRKLTPSQPILLTVQQVIALLNGPYLDINPDYQRDVVWSENQMSGLINSLLENYYVPPILFNKTQITLADGTTRLKRVCVDGKQRLSSIEAFVRGQIPCRDRKGKIWCVRRTRSCSTLCI